MSRMGDPCAIYVINAGLQIPCVISLVRRYFNDDSPITGVCFHAYSTYTVQGFRRQL